MQTHIPLRRWALMLTLSPVWAVYSDQEEVGVCVDPA